MADPGASLQVEIETAKAAEGLDAVKASSTLAMDAVVQFATKVDDLNRTASQTAAAVTNMAAATQAAASSVQSAAGQFQPGTRSYYTSIFGSGAGGAGVPPPLLPPAPPSAPPPGGPGGPGGSGGGGYYPGLGVGLNSLVGPAGAASSAVLNVDQQVRNLGLSLARASSGLTVAALNLSEFAKQGERVEDLESAIRGVGRASLALGLGLNIVRSTMQEVRLQMGPAIAGMTGLQQAMLVARATFINNPFLALGVGLTAIAAVTALFVTAQKKVTDQFKEQRTELEKLNAELLKAADRERLYEQAGLGFERERRAPRETIERAVELEASQRKLRLDQEKEAVDRQPGFLKTAAYDVVSAFGLSRSPEQGARFFTDEEKKDIELAKKYMQDQTKEIGEIRDRLLDSFTLDFASKVVGTSQLDLLKFLPKKDTEVEEALKKYNEDNAGFASKRVPGLPQEPPITKEQYLGVPSLAPRLSLKDIIDASAAKAQADAVQLIADKVDELTERIREDTKAAQENNKERDIAAQIAKARIEARKIGGPRSDITPEQSQRIADDEAARYQGILNRQVHDYSIELSDQLRLAGLDEAHRARMIVQLQLERIQRESATKATAAQTDAIYRQFDAIQRATLSARVNEQLRTTRIQEQLTVGSPEQLERRSYIEQARHEAETLGTPLTSIQVDALNQEIKALQRLKDVQRESQGLADALSGGVNTFLDQGTQKWGEWGAAGLAALEQIRQGILRTFVTDPFTNLFRNIFGQLANSSPPNVGIGTGVGQLTGAPPSGFGGGFNLDPGENL